MRRMRLTVVLYTRPGCGLCDEMKAGVAASALAGEVELREVDIAGDAHLEEQYGLRIPVLEHESRVICEGRLDLAALSRAVEGARI